MSALRAFVDDFGKITVVVSRSFYGGDTKGFYITGEDDFYGDCLVRYREEHSQEIIYVLTAPADLEFGKRYYMHEEHGKTCELELRFIVKSKIFDEMFTYTRDDLGANYQPTHTDFALWAPTAIEARLKLRLGKNVNVYMMKRTERGVFRVRVEGNLKNATYIYVLEINGKIIDTLDPYGLSSNANSKESAVIDVNEILEIEDHAKLTELESPCDAVIYECSVRDMTSHPLTGTTDSRTFKALCEAGTSFKQTPTGLDYLSSLGVTHVQLQPVVDFATVDEIFPTKNYNWGYDPAQIFALEGSYASKPNQPYVRMKEFKELVCTLHQRNIRVILDLVWNHMYDVETSPLNRTVPYYYFRFYESGYYSNGSYCGNDLDTQKPMMRKLFLRGIKVFMELYGVDGFRFDLMGIMDIETMNEIERLTHSYKKDALIYGEGWDMPTALAPEEKASLYNQVHMPNIGHFNDVYRDVLKGKTSDTERFLKGYLTGDLSASFDACSALLGHSVGEPYYKRFSAPTQSINAIETHDNATTWDKMHACCGEEPRDKRQNRQKMMIALTLLSQGVPFIHAGMEYCGTKKDISNSYMSGDEINGMNWQRADHNENIVSYTKKCIALRRRESLFRLTSEEEIRKHVLLIVCENGDLIYELYDDDTDIRVMINPSSQHHLYSFEEPWVTLLDENGNASKEPFQEYYVPGCSVVVITKA